MVEPAPRAPDLLDAALSLWRLSRPEVWLVTWVPMYVGHLLATREIVPGFARWAAFWASAAAEGETASGFFGTLLGWLGETRAFLFACLAMGPLVWAATLLVNDVHDLEGDRKNPRKSRSPLVQGLVTRGWALASAYVFATLAFAVALLVNLAFAAFTLAALALAWAYSAPPLRLKTRPGADVLVNAIGVGGLAGLAGWAIARPVAESPWPFLPQALLVAAAVYVPTTLVDHDADRASGYSTFATKLGPRRAYLVGFACWTLSCAGAIALAAAEIVIPRVMLPILVIFCPLLVFEYHAFIGKAETPRAMVKGILLCSFTFLAVNLVFALMYTGLWRA